MDHHLLLGANTGLRVSELALGLGRIGTAPGQTTDPAVVRAVLEAFADAGGTFLDTSSAYQQGRSEEMIGAFIADVGRERFVISSKYTRTTSLTPPPAAVGNHRRAMLAEVEGSLRRLRTDRIDVYFAHFDDGVTPIEEIMRGLEDLARAGKIVHVGLSNFPAWRIAMADTIAELRGWGRVAVLQMQYNLLERAIEREHLPLAHARGMAMMAWSPLAGGMLSRPVGEENQHPGAARVRDAVAAVAAEIGRSAAEVALAWVRAQGVIPVIGPRTPEQLAASVAALDMAMTAEQRRALDDASKLSLGYPYDLLAEQHLRLASG